MNGAAEAVTAAVNDAAAVAHVLSGSHVRALTICSVLSIALFLGFIVYFFVGIFKHRDYSISRRIIGYALWLLTVIFLARFAVLYFRGLTDEGYADFSGGVGLFRLFGSSLTNALQSFSMDENYDDFMDWGQKMLAAVGWGWGGKLFSVICVISNIFAPILGGAILLEILAGVYPQVFLFLHGIFHKFVFSCLNERSVSLAEDLYRDKGLHTIVFACTNENELDEEGSVLIQRAKKIGAVCTKEDVLHLRFRHSAAVDYYLIDENEDANVRSLTTLAAGAGEKKWLWNKYRGCRIFIFTDRAGNYGIVNAVCEIFDKAVNSDSGSRVLNLKARAPQIKLIFGYENRARSLFGQKPLYLPLWEKYGYDPYYPENNTLTREDFARIDKELTVTILGFGRIGRQMFRNAYWCGQMLNVSLHFNIVDYADNVTSDDGTQITAAEAYIRQSFPEIIPAAMEKDETLRKDIGDGTAGKEYALPYCQLSFYRDDVTAQEAEWELDKAHWSAGTDYYIVALGSDDCDQAVASGIERFLARWRVSHPEAPFSRPVIAYVIYDDALMCTLRASADGSKDQLSAIMYPFGSVRECYSYENVYFGDALSLYAPGHISEDNSQSSSELVLRMDSIFDAQGLDGETDQYNFDSSAARTVHLRYKMFSLGYSPESEQKEYFKRIFDGRSNDALCWLEHRRWNAYMRSRGFRCSSAFTPEMGDKKGIPPKDIRLKIHPCLVESCPEGSACDPDKNGPRPIRDPLDRVSEMRSGKGSFNDLKLWDDPEMDLNDCTIEEIIAYMKWPANDPVLIDAASAYLCSEEAAYRKCARLIDEANRDIEAKNKAEKELQKLANSGVKQKSKVIKKLKKVKGPAPKVLKVLQSYGITTPGKKERQV